MKKQLKTKKKLVLQKETLTSLEQVTGGSVYQNTVIIHWETDYCESRFCSPVYT